jgi:hypothetical protein
MKRENMKWFRGIAIVAPMLIIGIIITSCQLYDRDKSFDSKCLATCDNCEKLELQCDHIQVDDQTYTQNHPSEPHDTADE